MLRLGILASHQGTNFQSVADACRFGELDAYLAVLISNNSKAPVMKRAAELNVPAHHVSTATHKNAEDIDKAINAKLTEAKVGLVVLAGYMKKIGPLVLEEFKGRIINVGRRGGFSGGAELLAAFALLPPPCFLLAAAARREERRAHVDEGGLHRRGAEDHPRRRRRRSWPPGAARLRGKQLLPIN